MSDISNLIHEIKETDNPVLKAAKLSFYISDGLRNQRLSLYEAYLLQQEVIQFTREGYLLPAWSGRVQISTCLTLLNQRLLAQAFQDRNYARMLKQWALEAFQLCTEKRPHYIMDNYAGFLEIDREHTKLLETLSAVRGKYGSMSSDAGPYHVEVFPWHYFEPESILLGKAESDMDKQLSEDTESILIELNSHASTCSTINESREFS